MKLQYLLLVLTLLNAPVNVIAQGQSGGFYKELRSPNTGQLYRDNDVFVFCTQGRKPAIKAWKPIHAGSATFLTLYNYCPIPHNPQVTGQCPANTAWSYFLPWSQDDWDSYVLYREVCPHGGHQGDAGNWKGKGRPENSPHEH